MEEVSKVSNTEYTVKITIKQTTAYAGDNKGGKLTVYCPYYGNTGIGQINLTAASVGRPSIQSTNIEPLTILEKEAKDLTASITFTLEGEGAPPSNDYCLPVIIDNYYTLTDVQSVVTNNGTIEVETGSGFSQNLDYEGNAEDGWIKLGSLEYNAGTFKQHFILDENKNTTPRTGAVVVFSPSGREVARFVIKQDAKVVDNTPVINLVETNGNKAANCYIITDPGRYQIDTYMGAYNTDISSRPKCTGKPEVIWNEGGNDITPCQVGFSDNKLIFDVKGTINPGNAIIGIRNPKDANDILWSWHLWFCTPGEDPRLDENTDTYPDVTNVNVMNRALGAVSSDKQGISSYSVEYWKDGLFYQSGRKDPIRLNSNGTAAYDELPKNSDVEFDKNWTSNGWTSSKSEQDPCPPGYKVPTSSIWRDEPSGGLMETISTYSLTDVYPYDVVSSNIQGAILYPYCGYIDKTDKSFKEADVDGKDETLTYSRNIDYTYKFKDYSGLLPDKISTPIRITNVRYRQVDKNVKGIYGAGENQVLEYGYIENGVEVISYDYCTGYWSGKYIQTAKWNNDWKYNVSADNLNDNKDLLWYVANTLNIANSFSNITDLQSIVDLFVQKPIYNRKSDTSANGYQVRCVAE